MSFEHGTRLGPYEIIGPLGSGGMGEVYKARDTRLGRDVAIKVLPAAFSADSGRLRRFEKEARAVAALDHPNILVIHDIGAHEGAPYLITELLEGETLRESLECGPLPLRRAFDVAVQIAKGLAAAHEKGIIHRDLKPANVFVSKEGHVKILDFGIAKLAATGTAEDSATATVPGATTAGMALGTVGYMSPEQLRGRPVDHRADIFAFGCVLYEIRGGGLLEAKRPRTLSRRSSARTPHRSAAPAAASLRGCMESCAGAWRSVRRTVSPRLMILLSP